MAITLCDVGYAVCLQGSGGGRQPVRRWGAFHVRGGNGAAGED